MTENAAPDWPDWGLAAAVNAPDVGTATLWMRGELTRGERAPPAGRATANGTRNFQKISNTWSQP